MKKTYIIFLTVLFLFSACKEEDDVSKIVDVSYPTITLKGESLINLTTGAAYTDAGATLTDDISGAISDLAPTENEVDSSTPGLYVVHFSAVNENGFETEEARVVTVTSVNNPIDYSGSYLRAATGQVCVVEKVANGVYQISNPGGAAGASDVVIYMVETAPGTFVAPSQPSSVGSFGLIGITFSANTFRWTADNAGYGTAVRTFVKQ